MADKSKDMDFGAECSGSVAGTVMLFTDASLKAEVEWLEPSDVGLIGTQKPGRGGRQIAKKDVRGDVSLEASYAHMNAILQQCFDEAAGTFTPADSPEDLAIDVVLNRKVQIYTYADCWLNELELSASENEAIAVRLGLLGKDEEKAGAVGALVLPDRMRMADLSVAIGADNYFPTRFAWMWTYDLVERFHNSIIRSHVMARIPKCTLELDLDQNSDTYADLYAKAGTNSPVDDVVLTLTDGVNTVTITMPEMTVMNASEPQDISGIEEITGTVELRAWLDDAESDILEIAYA